MITQGGVHADRATRRHRDYSPPGWPLIAGVRTDAGERTTDHLSLESGPDQQGSTPIHVKIGRRRSCGNDLLKRQGDRLIKGHHLSRCPGCLELRSAELGARGGKALVNLAAVARMDG